METRWTIQPVSIGWLIAVLVVIACFVLWITGMLDAKLALLIGALGLARLV